MEVAVSIMSGRYKTAPAIRKDAPRRQQGDVIACIILERSRVRRTRGGILTAILAMALYTGVVTP